MVNFPEGWGKGHLPEGWGKKAGSSSEKDKNTDNLIENVEESEQDFLTGDEIKAKLGSELSNFKKVLDTHTDAIKNSTKYVGKKSNKVSEEKTKSGVETIKDYNISDEKHIELSTEPKMEENTPSFNHSENISSTPDEISNNPKNEKSKKRFILIISFVVVGIIAILIGIFLFLYFYKNNESSVVSESETVSDMQSMVESATIEVFTPYQLQIESLGALIYSGPGYEYAIVDSIQEVGSYTIIDEVQQTTGDEITTWGKLESDRGWINLNEINRDTTENSLNYILPYSSERLLIEDDIRNLSMEQLTLARNEIYARHGRIFQDETIRAHFESQSWYHGTIAPEDFSANLLSEIEQKNIEFIRTYELYLELEIEQKNSSIKQNDTPTAETQTSLTESEAKKLLKTLIPSAKKLESLIYGSSLPYSQSDYVVKGVTTYYAVTDPNYQSIADIKAAVESVYTKQVATEHFYKNRIDNTSNPAFIEENGKLYVSPGGIGGGYTWDIDGLTMLKTENPNVVFIQIECEGYGSITNETIKICKENGKWLLGSVIY